MPANVVTYFTRKGSRVDALLQEKLGHPGTLRSALRPRKTDAADTVVEEVIANARNDRATLRRLRDKFDVALRNAGDDFNSDEAEADPGTPERGIREEGADQG